MTDTPRLLAWLRATLDDHEKAARKAAALCGCHPPAPSWSFHDGDEPTDGRILIVNDPHPDMKWKIGRRWNSSYQGLFMAEHIVRHDPAAVLRRIAKERELLDDCENIIAGWHYDETKQLAEDTIRNRAEAWGWTKETT